VRSREALEWFERVDGGWTDEFRACAYATFAEVDFDLLEDGPLMVAVAYGADGRFRGMARKRRSNREMLDRLRGTIDQDRAASGAAS
jgi:hypothetical protein